MFKNKAHDGRNNLCGANIAAQRTRFGMSQRELADKLQLQGTDLSKNAIQRLESGERFVTDIELKAFAEVLGCPVGTLLEGSSVK